MKRFLIALTLLISIAATTDAFARSGGSGGSHSTRGYTTKKGTYVAPHHQTNPNATRNDNWSTKGNTNPYTGKPGTK
jgi:hypothetical protein